MKMGTKATGDPIRDNWITPSYIMESVDNFFQGQYFDPFPINPHWDAYRIPWGDNIWLNPPYSKLSEIVKLPQYKGKVSLWLTHTSHDVKWYKYLASQSTAICQLYDRVKFIDPKTHLPSKSTAIGKCQSIFLISPKHDLEKFSEIFGKLGRVMVEYK